MTRITDNHPDLALEGLLVSPQVSYGDIAYMDNGSAYSQDQVLTAYELGKKAGSDKPVPFPNLFCGECACNRSSEKCFKCGSDTFTPHPSWVPLKNPPIDLIRSAAKEVGYALTVHGSLERDYDLVAIPWVDEAIGNAALMEHLAKAVGGRLLNIESRPHGRYVCIIQMDGWYKPIDLSITTPFISRTKRVHETKGD